MRATKATTLQLLACEDDQDIMTEDIPVLLSGGDTPRQVSPQLLLQLFEFVIAVRHRTLDIHNTHTSSLKYPLCRSASWHIPFFFLSSLLRRRYPLCITTLRFCFVGRPFAFSIWLRYGVCSRICGSGRVAWHVKMWRTKEKKGTG